MSTRVTGTTVIVTLSASATLSTGPVRMSLTARQGPAPGIWQYNLNDSTDNRAGHGRIADKTNPLNVLRYAAGICVADCWILVWWSILRRGWPRSPEWWR